MGNAFTDEPATREARVVQRTFELVAGGIVLVTGAALLGLTVSVLAKAAWMAIPPGTAPAGMTWMLSTVMVCALAVAIFFVQVGARLVWHRPTAHGSLLSAAGWATLGFVFVGVAAATSVAVVRAGGAMPIGLDLGLLLVATPCFLRAHQLHRRSRLPR